VIKSGMALRVVQTEDTVITIRGSFHVQIPSYAPEDERSTVSAENEARAKQIMSTVDAIAADLSDITSTWGYYSNMWEATSTNLTELSNGALEVNLASYATSEKPKTVLEPVYGNTTPIIKKTAYSTCAAGGGTCIGAPDDITLNGVTFDTVSTGALDNLYTSSKRTMTALLEEYPTEANTVDGEPALVLAGHNNVVVEFKASDLEKKLITTDREELSRLAEELQSRNPTEEALMLRSLIETA
jgi:hypothetical protein